MPETRKVLKFVFKIITNRSGFFFWLFIRFLSALIPMLNIYLFSYILRLLEQQQPLRLILSWAITLLFSYVFDNFIRIKSVTKLEAIISGIVFDVHNFFLSDLKTKSKEDRHAAIQAIRNFSDATSLSLNLIKQPGIDSLVSLVSIPIILFVLDFKIFILATTYISIYYFIDHYTTERYARRRDALNTKTEIYYAKLQETNDCDLEQHAFSLHFNRLIRWGFTEWFALQNTAVIFYSLILGYLVYSVSTGDKAISDLVLIASYSAQIQLFLNSFSQIQDSLTDMMVGIKHLATNSHVSSLDLNDLL